MQFSKIIGQPKEKEFLCEVIRENRLPHAILLLGSEGTGGLPMALAIAQYLNCENRHKFDSCGACASCRKASKFIHPDIHFSFPTIGSKAKSEDFSQEWRLALTENPYMNTFQWLQSIGGEGKQGNITAEECRRIVQKLSLKIFEGQFKVLIMWMPEYLGKEGNRLLKLIEEPPENTVILLVAEDQDQLLNTILSRCQLVKLKALNDAEILESMVNQGGVSSDQAASIAYLSNGNYNQALQLLDLAKSGKESDNSLIFLDWLRKCYLGDAVEMVQWVEAFAKMGRENQKFFLNYGLHFLREYLYLKMTGSDEVRLLKTELETAQKMMRVLSFAKVEKMSTLFTDCAYYVERNANPKILFLDASIQLHQIFKR